MKKSTKIIVCIILLILVIYSIVAIILSIKPLTAAVKDYIHFTTKVPKKDVDTLFKDFNHRNKMQIVGFGLNITAGIITIVINTFIIFTFVSNSNALGYVKLTANDMETRFCNFKRKLRKIRVAKIERTKKRLQEKIDKINQKTV